MMTLLFYGLPLVSLVTAVVALVKRSWKWMLFSWVCLLPIALYLSATPRFTGYMAVSVFHLGAVVALGKQRLDLAKIAMCVPLVVTVGAVLFALGRQ